MTIRGHIENGQLILEKPVPLPDQSRVEVTLQPIRENETDATSHWQQVKERLRERPIHSGGQHFTRDELHERG
jgi:hypothetical protein